LQLQSGAATNGKEMSDSISRADFYGVPTDVPAAIDLARLHAALEASWDERTAYQGAMREGNPAFGQCYPTARVVQWWFPECEIAAGDVDTGEGMEAHFWCVRRGETIDFTWGQFPSGSKIRKSRLLERDTLNDSPSTIERCQLLLERVLAVLMTVRAQG